MHRRIPLNRWLAIAAAAVLVATAAIHGSGYASVSTAVGARGLNPALGDALRAVWLMISFHLVLLAIVVIVASGVERGRRIVLACALIPAADTVLLLHFVGVFVGSLALAAATLLLVSSGLLPSAVADSSGRLAAFDGSQSSGQR